jgi:glutamyl-tRNA reductase
MRANQQKREAFNVVKQSAEKVSISIARSNEYIAWKYQYILKESFLTMRDYTARRLHEKINEEKARTFYLERTLPIFYYNSFKAWKDQTMQTLQIIEEKVNVIQEQLVVNRVKECIQKLQKHAQTQKELRYKTDPTNPRFTDYLEGAVNKHYKKYFKKMFHFAETK